MEQRGKSKIQYEHDGPKRTEACNIIIMHLSFTTLYYYYVYVAEPQSVESCRV